MREHDENETCVITLKAQIEGLRDEMDRMGGMNAIQLAETLEHTNQRLSVSKKRLSQSEISKARLKLQNAELRKLCQKFESQLYGGAEDRNIPLKEEQLEGQVVSMSDSCSGSSYSSTSTSRSVTDLDSVTLSLKEEVVMLNKEITDRENEIQIRDTRIKEMKDELMGVLSCRDRQESKYKDLYQTYEGVVKDLGYAKRKEKERGEQIGENVGQEGCTTRKDTDRTLNRLIESLMIKVEMARRQSCRSHLDSKNTSGANRADLIIFEDILVGLSQAKKEMNNDNTIQRTEDHLTLTDDRGSNQAMEEFVKTVEAENDVLHRENEALYSEIQDMDKTYKAAIGSSLDNLKRIQKESNIAVDCMESLISMSTCAHPVDGLKCQTQEMVVHSKKPVGNSGIYQNGNSGTGDSSSPENNIDQSTDLIPTSLTNDSVCVHLKEKRGLNDSVDANLKEKKGTIPLNEINSKLRGVSPLIGSMPLVSVTSFQDDDGTHNSIHKRAHSSCEPHTHGLDERPKKSPRTTPQESAKSFFPEDVNDGCTDEAKHDTPYENHSLNKLSPNICTTDTINDRNYQQEFIDKKYQHATQGLGEEQKSTSMSNNPDPRIIPTPRKSPTLQGEEVGARKIEHSVLAITNQRVLVNKERNNHVRKRSAFVPHENKHHPDPTAIKDEDKPRRKNTTDTINDSKHQQESIDNQYLHATRGLGEGQKSTSMNNNPDPRIIRTPRKSPTLQGEEVGTRKIENAVRAITNQKELVNDEQNNHVLKRSAFVPHENKHYPDSTAVKDEDKPRRKNTTDTRNDRNQRQESIDNKYNHATRGLGVRQMSTSMNNNPDPRIIRTPRKSPTLRGKEVGTRKNENSVRAITNQKVLVNDERNNHVLKRSAFVPHENKHHPDSTAVKDEDKPRRKKNSPQSLTRVKSLDRGENHSDRKRTPKPKKSPPHSGAAETIEKENPTAVTTTKQEPFINDKENSSSICNRDEHPLNSTDVMMEKEKSKRGMASKISRRLRKGSQKKTETNNLNERKHSRSKSDGTISFGKMQLDLGTWSDRAEQKNEKPRGNKKGSKTDTGDAWVAF